jgi:hypothetical protein
MITVHRGAGMLVPVFGILCALIMNIATNRLAGASYYQEHKWPKFAVLLTAGLFCLAVGRMLKRKRLRDVNKEQLYLDSLNPRFETTRQFAFSGPRDHLMFIPLEYWSLVYLGAAIIYAIV